jgi:hypothetical protein
MIKTPARDTSGTIYNETKNSGREDERQNTEIKREVNRMKQVSKGIVEGNVIRLEKPIELPQGTSILVSFTTLYKERQEAIKQRQLKLLDQGFNLGKKLYSSREDLYAR